MKSLLFSNYILKKIFCLIKLIKKVEILKNNEIDWAC